VKKIGGVILGILVFAIVGQVLIFLGPAIGGWIVIALERTTPNSRLANNLEAFGYIFVLIVSIYLGIKTYKKVAGKTKTKNR